MNNIVFGIITIVLCSLGYYFSFNYPKKDNYQIAVLLLIICGLVIRLFTAFDFYLHFWDERYHALVAKNLINHPLIPTLYENPILQYDYKNWVGNHIWVHKQPLPLWVMSLSLHLFGFNEIALRLPSIILTTVGIWITFEIGSKLFNKKVGFLAAFFYSINGLIVEITAGRVATDHPDVFFLFFIELAIYFSIVFAQKDKLIYNILAGISIGAAILSKWLPALIVLPIWLLIVLEFGGFNYKKIAYNFIILVTICIIVFLPWQLYIFNVFPVEAKYEASFNMKHITEALEGQTGPFYYFFDKIRINYGDLIYLPLLWFFYDLYKNTTNKKQLILLVWFLVPTLFFSIAKTKMQGYILFTSPALFIITALFYFVLSEYMIIKKTKWFYSLILFLLIALPIRYTFERVKPFENINRNPKWVTDLKKLNERKIIKGILFNYCNEIEAMFYTDLTVYSKIPSKELIIELISKGHTVLINDDGKIPNDIKQINGIVIENLEVSNQ
jgi:4-amino-4-deoxy-L-arabinose transferase-like glycosyltransferase